VKSWAKTFNKFNPLIPIFNMILTILHWAKNQYRWIIEDAFSEKNLPERY
jgi:hypothetical protein